jgi:alanine racemase
MRPVAPNRYPCRAGRRGRCGEPVMPPMPESTPPEGSRPLQALVHLAALAHNLGVARERAGRRRLWAVVKANAYGHGIENAVRAFPAADGLALLELSEARRARAAGWAGPILLLEGAFAPGDLAVARELGLTVVVHCEEQLRMLELMPGGAAIPVYVKFDTGMNRLGFRTDGVDGVLARVHALAGQGRVRPMALMTHLANADREASGAPSVAGQRAALAALAPGWKGETSVSNSAALFLELGARPPDAAQVQETWARPGIALYGASPRSGTAPGELGLKAAMTLRARLLTVRELRAGESVGYGSLWRAPRASRVGILACGYADGYPRAAPAGTPAFVRGRRVPLVGRVSMDMLSVDLTGVDGAGTGDWVELWGAHVGVDEVAERAGTVGYELLSALPARVREIAAEDLAHSDRNGTPDRPSPAGREKGGDEGADDGGAAGHGQT